jgi:hypothetical protein
MHGPFSIAAHTDEASPFSGENTQDDTGRPLAIALNALIGNRIRVALWAAGIDAVDRNTMQLNARETEAEHWLTQIERNALTPLERARFQRWFLDDANSREFCVRMTMRVMVEKLSEKEFERRWGAEIELAVRVRAVRACGSESTPME